MVWSSLTWQCTENILTGVFSDKWIKDSDINLSLNFQTGKKMLRYTGCCKKSQRPSDADNILLCGHLMGLQVHA